MALLSVKDVQAGYCLPDGRKLQAVDGVSVSLKRGEVLGVAGESGCGKSTLATILALNARAPMYVDQGEMTLMDEEERTIDLTSDASLTRANRGKLIAVLPQSAMNSINPTVRVRDLAFDVLRGSISP